jgi:hypothetical protein
MLQCWHGRQTILALTASTLNSFSSHQFISTTFVVTSRRYIAHPSGTKNFTLSPNVSTICLSVGISIWPLCACEIITACNCKIINIDRCRCVIGHTSGISRTRHGSGRRLCSRRSGWVGCSIDVDSTGSKSTDKPFTRTHTPASINVLLDSLLHIPECPNHVARRTRSLSVGWSNIGCSTGISHCSSYKEYDRDVLRRRQWTSSVYGGRSLPRFSGWCL